MEYFVYFLFLFGVVLIITGIFFSLRKDTLYYYDVSGEQQKGFDCWHIVLVSEGKLPNFSKKYDRMCSYFSPDIPTDILSGSIIDVAFGDPRILKRCKLISWNLDGAPKEIIEDALGKQYSGITLEYRGKKIWALTNWLCLEKDLL